MNPQVLIATDCYFPELKSVSVLIRDLAWGFRDAGFDPLIVAADQSCASASAWSHEDGIDVLRVRCGQTKRASHLKRGVSELRLSDLLTKAVDEHRTKVRPSLVVFYSPSIFLANFVAEIKRRHACPSYLILRDVFPDWALEVKAIRNPVIAWWLKKQARHQYDVADQIGVQSARDLELFTTGRHGDQRQKTGLLRNWRYSQPGAARPIRTARSTGPVTFVVGGVIGAAQDPFFLIELAKSLSSEPNIHFRMIGEGNLKDRVEARAKELGLRNLTISPALPRERFLEELSASDVGVLLLAAELSTDNVPGRLLDYLECSLPILALVNPSNELLRFIPDRELGRAAASNDLEAAKGATLEMARSIELRRRAAEVATKVLQEEFSSVSAVETILKSSGVKPRK